MPTIIDSYSESNQNYYDTVYGTKGGGLKGQSFTGDGKTLNSCKFYLKKEGSPTGNAVAKIYAHTGTYGTNGKPTGAVLSTSNVFDVSTLTTDFALADFAFTGAEKITLVNGTHYCIIFEYTGGDGSNCAVIGLDTSSPTHSGNKIYYFFSSWQADNTQDICFYVYGDVEYTLTCSDSVTAVTTIIQDTTKKKVLSLSITESMSTLSEFSLTESETLAVVISISNDINVPLDETVQMIESLIKEVDVSFSEALAFIEDISKVITFNKLFLEVLSISENLKKDQNVIIAILLDILESSSRETDSLLEISDLITFVESISISFDLSKQEAFTLVDSVLTAQNIIRTDAETLVLSETLQKTIGLTEQDTLLVVESLSSSNTKMMTETLSLTEIFTQQFGLSQSSAVTLIDSFVTQTIYSKTLSETLELIESLQQLYNISKAEAINIVDAMSSISGSTKTFVDVVQFAEISEKTIEMITQESLLLSETLQHSIDLSKQEALTFVESLSIIKSKTLIETLSLVEIFIKYFGATQSSAITLVDSLATDTTYSKALSETLAIVEHLQQHYNLSTTEAVNIIDLITTIAGSTFTLDDVVDIASDKTLQNEISKQESLAVAESSSLLIEFTRIFSDILTLLEANQLTQSISHVDVVALIDFFQTVTGTGISLADTLSIASAYTKLTGKNIDKTLTFVETFVKHVDILSQDSFTIDDNIIHINSLINSDLIVLDESIIKNINVSKISSFTSIESASVVASFARELSELLEIIEDKTIIQDKIETIQDEIIIAEIIKKSIDIPVDSTLVIVDDVSTSLGEHLLNISDIVQFSDIHSARYSAIFVEDVEIIEALTTRRGLINTEDENISFIDSLLASSTLSLEEALELIESKDTLKKGPLNDIAIARTDQHKTILNNTKKRTILVVDKTRTFLLTKE